MSLKTAIVSRVTASLTSEERLRKARRKAETARLKQGLMHTVHYFHQADDPYSHLMVQALPALLERYDIRVVFHLVSAPPDWAAPDRQRLIDYARRDAHRLARKAGFAFEDPGKQPALIMVERAESALAALIDGQCAVERAAAISTALWSGDAPTTPSADPIRVAEIKADGDALREAQGHYLGGTVLYGGEWYWGIDRLHYLEARLRNLDAVMPDTPATNIFPPPGSSGQALTGPLLDGTELEAFLSFRSPYSYIAAAQAKALADHYGVPLKIRTVLPMVMRGLDVPRTKARYILFDATREARRLGIPFGKIADPVGTPVERGYAILPYAFEEGLEAEFCISFLKGVWSEGIDAGSRAGLRTIVNRAGLNWQKAQAMLGTDHWRTMEAENQETMLGLGLWGVPSFRVGDVSTWGQDRLWVVDDALAARVEPEGNQNTAQRL